MIFVAPVIVVVPFTATVVPVIVVVPVTLPMFVELVPVLLIFVAPRIVVVPFTATVEAALPIVIVFADAPVPILIAPVCRVPVFILTA